MIETLVSRYYIRNYEMDFLSNSDNEKETNATF